MSNNVSDISVVPAALRGNANRLWWAWGKDSNPNVEESGSFTIGLNTTEAWPPTHYALASWVSTEDAQVLVAMPDNGGTLPPLTRTLADAGLTESEALAVCAAVDNSCRTSGTPMENFNAVCGATGLMRVFDPEA